MHFTRLLGICLLPMASFAVPVTLSLSVLLDDASMAEFGHHHSGMKAFGRGNHERIASGKTISPETYLGYLSDYWGNLTEADKALKDLKVPDQKDDDDTWDEYTRRYDLANDCLKNVISAIDYAVYAMRDSEFDGQWNKADTKAITEALGNNFGKINETLIEPITTAVKSEIFFSSEQGHRLQQLGHYLARLAPRTAERCYSGSDEDDPYKDPQFDNATRRNIAIVVDAMNSVKAAGNTLSESRVVQAKHRTPFNQWKLQL